MEPLIDQQIENPVTENLFRWLEEKINFLCRWRNLFFKKNISESETALKKIIETRIDIYSDAQKLLRREKIKNEDQIILWLESELNKFSELKNCSGQTVLIITEIIYNIKANRNYQ